MKRFLRSKLTAVVLVITLVSLIAGVAMAANNSSNSRQNLTSSVVEIVPDPWQVPTGGRLDVYGAGFRPNELVLLEIFISDTDDSVVIEGGRADAAGTFVATTEELPSRLVAGVYTIKARTLTSPHVASAPLVVCESSEGKC